MDLIERYLAVVGCDLPQRHRADITAELRDVLQSQVEEREAALGRPLKRDEVEDLLEAFGHPLVVAGRYRSVQQLIGPQVFPFWWAAVRAAAAITLGVYFVSLVVNVIGLGDSGLIGRAMPGLVDTLVYVFGVVTLVFLALERFGGVSVLTRWRPRDLPPPTARRRSRFEQTVEIGMGVVFILWWTGFVRFQDVITLDRPIPVAMGPVWADWYWPILAYAAVDLGVNLLGLLRPGWVQANRALSLGRHLAGAGILLGLMQAGNWVVITLPELTDMVMPQVELGIRIGLGVAAMVMLVKAGWDGWRLYRDAGEPVDLRTGRAPG
jgi:hypothetical protein